MSKQGGRGGLSWLVGCGCLLVLGALGGVVALIAPLFNALTGASSLVPAGVFEQCENGDGEGGEDSGGSTAAQVDASGAAENEVPVEMLELYREAGEEHGIDWAVLAAIGYTESRHGTDESTEQENWARALGPMQFTPATWEEYGIGPDGEESDDLDDRRDPAYAVHSAGNMLFANGVNEDLEGALWRYNQSSTYVDHVTGKRDEYANSDFQPAQEDRGGTDENVNVVPAADLEECPEMAESGAGDGGTVAAADSEDAQTVLDWALEQRGKPYIWGGTGPAGFDCSGLVMRAYEQVGLTIPRVTHDQVNYGPKVDEGDAKPGDLVFFNTEAAGANTGPQPRHVGMVVDGEAKRLVEAWCTDCGPIATRSWDDRDIHSITRPLAAGEG